VGLITPVLDLGSDQTCVGEEGGGMCQLAPIGVGLSKPGRDDKKGGGGLLNFESVNFIKLKFSKVSVKARSPSTLSRRPR